MNNAFLIINKNFKHEFLLKNNLLIQKPNYLCGISGGQDSIFLLIWLLHLQNKWNFNLSILHCHHLWQQSNFLACRQLYKLSYLFKISICVNIGEVALNNEVDARNWRQEAYKRTILFVNCEKLILGHTATDQTETALFNLIRGTSPQGFCGLKEIKQLVIPFYICIFPSLFFNTEKYKYKQRSLKNKCYSNFIFLKKKVFFKKIKTNISCVINFRFFYKPRNFISLAPRRGLTSFIFLQNSKKKGVLSKTLIRPLAFLHRNDITELVKFYHVPVINDFTNSNIIFSRNKIRHQVFPKLRTLFKQPFDYKFYQYLQISLDEQDYIDNLVKNLIIKTYKFDKKKFKDLAQALQRRYIYLVLESYLKRKINYFQIEFLIYIISQLNI